jgi:phosphatidylserine/phosphatidylglycerophosphate/cardiolipin synthase-like enzyme
MPDAQIHFGGPGSPDGALRELLSQRVAAVPAGGAIDVVSYYFRDRGLADDLARASRRGVRVRVTLEATPRSPHANADVAEQLAEALGGDFRALAHPRLMPLPRARLHEKLYLFSDPAAAFVGSFNPSSNADGEDASAIAAIGDQDRGYNSLVELRDPTLLQGLREHARRLQAARHGLGERFLAAERDLHSGDTSVHFWPQPGLDRGPLRALLAGLGPGERARIAASHLSGATFPRALERAARHGAAIELVSHASERRFPARVARRLAAAGIGLRRAGSDAAVPMHEKFALIEHADERVVTFGSFNLTERSLWLNHELTVISRDPALFEGYAARFEQLTQ